MGPGTQEAEFRSQFGSHSLDALMRELGKIRDDDLADCESLNDQVRPTREKKKEGGERERGRGGRRPRVHVHLYGCVLIASTECALCRSCVSRTRVCVVRAS